MTEDRAQSLVVGCLAASAAVAAGNSIAAGQAPELSQLVGFTFVGVGLATASMFAPGLAGSFAVLVLTSTVFLYGGPLYDAVTTATTPSTTTNPQQSRRRAGDDSTRKVLA